MHSAPAYSAMSITNTTLHHGLPGHTMLGDSLPDMGHATVEQKDTLQVKVESYKTLDTTNYSPLGEAFHPTGKPEPPAEGATLSSSATASSLLDKLLAGPTH